MTVFHQIEKNNPFWAFWMKILKTRLYKKETLNLSATVSSQYAQSEYAESLGYASSGDSESPYPKSGYAEIGYAKSEYDGSGYADSEYAESGYANSGYAESGYSEIGSALSGYTESGYAIDVEYEIPTSVDEDPVFIRAVDKFKLTKKELYQDKFFTNYLRQDQNPIDPAGLRLGIT